MQNMIQLQDDLKNFSEQQLVREMQMPSGQVPQFLILTELGRRKRMKDDFSRQQAAGAPTVAEETVAAAGMPVGASTDMSKAMAPKTSMTENTGIGTMMPKQPTRMADGGDVEPKNRFDMLMAYLRSLREKEEEPKPTSTGPSIAEMINFGGDYEPVKKAEGGVVKMRTGGTMSAIESLKVNYPELYEKYKDEPATLAYVARTMIETAKEPEQTGIESLETDMTEQAAPFVPKIPMDTSGATRPVGPSGTLFNIPMGQIGEFFTDPFAAANPSTSSYEDYKLRYEPAKPGEYYYKGNAFILSPDGTMVERKSGVPVTGTTRDKIIAANATQVPIENYGQPPTSNIALFEKLIADQQEGMPVENITTTTKDTAGKPVEIDPAAISGAQVTPSPSTIATPSLLTAPQSETFEGSVPQTEETTRSSENRPSFDTGDSATIQGVSTLEDFSIEPGLNTPAVREFLANERSRGIADAGRGVVRHARNNKLGALESRFTTSDDPINNLINKRAQEYLQSDMYTPPEDIYDLSPKGSIKYETEDPEERDKLFAETTQREFLERRAADRLAEKRMNDLPSMETELQDARVADLIGGKISDDNTFPEPEVPDGIGKTAVDIAANVVKKVGEVTNKAAEKGADMAISRKASRSNEVVLGEGAEFIDPATTQKAQIEAEKAALENLLNPKPDTKGGGKGGGKGGAGGGLEGQLADMLKDMDKSREQDKWLALANTGLALMSSKQPTLGGALGEAGMAGMKQLQEGKKQYSKDKMTILALQQRIDASKRAAASKSSGLSASQSLTRGLAILKQGQDMMENAQIAKDPMAAERAQQLINYGNALMGIPNIGSTGTGAIKAPSAS